MYLAVIPTSYTTYAIAETKAAAKNAALKSAKKFLDSSDFPTTLASIEEELGCNIHEIGIGEAVQAA